MVEMIIIRIKIVLKFKIVSLMPSLLPFPRKSLCRLMIKKGPDALHPLLPVNREVSSRWDVYNVILIFPFHSIKSLFSQKTFLGENTINPQGGGNRIVAVKFSFRPEFSEKKGVNLPF